MTKFLKSYLLIFIINNNNIIVIIIVINETNRNSTEINNIFFKNLKVEYLKHTVFLPTDGVTSRNIIVKNYKRCGKIARFFVVCF